MYLCFINLLQDNNFRDLQGALCDSFETERSQRFKRVGETADVMRSHLSLVFKM